MALTKPRNDHVRLLWRRLLILGLVLVLLFGIWAVIGVYLKDKESQDLRAQAERQLSDLRERELNLNEKISTLETDRGQEEALRDQYQVGKAGEGMITIVDQPASSSPPAPLTQQSWWSRFFWW